MFPTEIYVERRNRLKTQESSGILLFPGHSESPMNYVDNPYPFRQDASFLYFFGLDKPDLVGLIDIDENRDMMFGDDISIEHIIWMGPQPSVADQCRAAGITETAPMADLAGYLSAAQQKNRPIHFLNPYRPENMILIGKLLNMPPHELAGHMSVPLTRAVAAQRSIKSPDEVAEIEKALNLSYVMQTEAMKASGPGRVEQEIVGIMEGALLSANSRISFPTIFTIHGETLHNHVHHNVMQDGDIVINDSGAESPLHYASDITRTFPVSGTFTQKQKDVYAIVLNAHEQAMAAVRPGVPFRDVHTLACEKLTAGLKELGLMQGDIKEAVEAGAHALFFQCGLGHMLGLDTHDMESLGEDYVGYTDTIKRSPQFGRCSLRLGKPLEPGYVITVEPGLYFIPELVRRWRAEGKFTQFINYETVENYLDFGGVRIEDDLLVTETGHRILGPAIPKTIPDVEAMCNA